MVWKIWVLAWWMTCCFLLTPAPAESQRSVDQEQYELTFSKGLLLFRARHYEEASSLFTRALLAKPNDHEASYYLGQTLIRLKRADEAEAVFKKMVQAHPASGKALLGLGMAQFYQEQYSLALKSLAAAQVLEPKEQLIFYYQGLASAKLAFFDQALEAFTRTMALDPVLAPEAQHQRGIVYAQLGRLEQAMEEFEAVVQAVPDTELGRSAKTNLELITAALPKKPRSWELNVSLSSQYDSNVVLLPIGVQPPGGPTGISRKDDTKTLLTLRSEYRLLQKDRWTFAMGYGVLQSFHRSLHGFDVLDHTPSVYLQHHVGKVQARVQYNFDYVEVGRSPFLFSHSVHPSLTIFESPSTFTQFEFRYQNKEFRDDRFLFNSTRNGKNWLGGVTQYFMFVGTGGYLRVGYVYDTDRTGGGAPSAATPGVPTGADWAYQGHRVLGGVGFPTMLTIKLDLGFDYYLQEYDHPNSFSATGTIRRKDDIFRYIGTLSREITPAVSLGFQYVYTRNQSNLPVFDYTRSIYALILSGRF